MFHGRNYGATVTAGVLLSCVMMSNESFNHLVKLILEDLRAKAEQYKKILNAFVQKKTKKERTILKIIRNCILFVNSFFF